MQRLAPLFVACLLAGFWGVHLASFYPLENDECLYVSIARESVQTGSWLVPQFRGEPFLEKPPLAFWPLYPVAAAGSNNPGILRLGKVGWLVLGTAVFYLIARRFVGREMAWMSPLVLLTIEPFLIDHGVLSVTMEGPLVVGWLTAMLGALRWGRGQAWGAVLIGVGVGVGILVKSIAGMPPLVIWLMAALIARRRVKVRDLVGIAGPIVLFALPWIGFYAWMFGGPFWDELYRQGVGGRVLGAIDVQHRNDWTYYLKSTAFGFRWWWLPLAWGFASLLPRLRRCEYETVLVALWAGVPLLLYSLMVSKLSHYLYPAYPALALGVGCGLQAMFQPTRLDSRWWWLVAGGSVAAELAFHAPIWSVAFKSREMSVPLALVTRPLGIWAAMRASARQGHPARQADFLLRVLVVLAILPLLWHPQGIGKPRVDPWSDLAQAIDSLPASQRPAIVHASTSLMTQNWCALCALEHWSYPEFRPDLQVNVVSQGPQLWLVSPTELNQIRRLARSADVTIDSTPFWREFRSEGSDLVAFGPSTVILEKVRPFLTGSAVTGDGQRAPR